MKTSYSDEMKQTAWNICFSWLLLKSFAILVRALLVVFLKYSFLLVQFYFIWCFLYLLPFNCGVQLFEIFSVASFLNLLEFTTRMFRIIYFLLNSLYKIFHTWFLMLRCYYFPCHLWCMDSFIKKRPVMLHLKKQMEKVIFYHNF